MAENCSVLDPWIYRHDSAWLSEASALENAALTRALQMSLSDTTTTTTTATTTTTTTTSSASAADTLSSSLLLPSLQFTPSPSASSSAAALLRPSPAGRVSKRKSRAGKLSATTYIETDPANFREMVQRVTGLRGAGKPQARASVGSGRATAAALQQICLPTLDTSALLLDSGAIGNSNGSGLFGQQPPAPAPVQVDALGFDFDSLIPAFPTLDSWAVL